MKKGLAVFSSLIPPRKMLTHKKFPPGISDYIMHDILLLPLVVAQLKCRQLIALPVREKRQTVDFRFMFLIFPIVITWGDGWKVLLNEKCSESWLVFLWWWICYNFTEINSLTSGAHPKRNHQKALNNMQTGRRGGERVSEWIETNL